MSSSSFPQLLRALDGPLLLAEIWSGRSINRRNKKEKRKDYIIPGGGCDIGEWVNEWLTAQIYRLDPWPPASMHSTPNPWMSKTHLIGSPRACRGDELYSEDRSLRLTQERFSGRDVSQLNGIVKRIPGWMTIGRCIWNGDGDPDQDTRRPIAEYIDQCWFICRYRFIQWSWKDQHQELGRKRRWRSSW